MLAVNHIITPFLLGNGNTPVILII